MWENLRDFFGSSFGTKMSGIPGKNWQPPFVQMETSMGAVTLELYWYDTLIIRISTSSIIIILLKTIININISYCL